MVICCDRIGEVRSNQGGHIMNTSPYETMLLTRLRAEEGERRAAKARLVTERRRTADAPAASVGSETPPTVLGAIARALLRLEADLTAAR